MMRHVKNVDYIHDFGGVKTSDGHTLKSKLLFRSANLALINEEEIDLLVNQYGVNHVIDLRTIDEMKYRPEDFISPKIQYHPLPLVSNEMNPAITKENRIQILNDLVALPGGMRGHILDLYRYLINVDQAKNGYHQVFEYLLSNNGHEGFLFHCTQGKDRTGIVMLLVLSALGVSLDTIYQLYLSFNHRARFKRAAYFLGMNIRFSWKKAVALNDTLTAKRLYLRTAIDEIESKYGSILEYLHNEVKISDSDIAKLKQIYLN